MMIILQKIGHTLLLLLLAVLAFVPFTVGAIVNFIIISVATGYSQCPELITDLIYKTKVLFGIDLVDEDEETPEDENY